MEQICTIGLDIAKSVFQVHGIDEAGKVVVLRQLKRRGKYLVQCGPQGAAAGDVGKQVGATSSRASFHLSALDLRPGLAHNAICACSGMNSVN